LITDLSLTGNTPSSSITNTASSGTISGVMDPVKQMQQRAGLAKLDGDKVRGEWMCDS
jgi:hypothetical protein